MDEALELAEKAAKNAKRAAALTVLAVAVAIAVLAIDNGIKKAMLDEAKKARLILDEFRGLVEKHTVRVEVTPDGAEAAGEAGAAAGDSVDAGGGVVHDAASGADVDEAPGAAKPAPARRAARAARGPRRDG